MSPCCSPEKVRLSTRWLQGHGYLGDFDDEVRGSMGV